MIEGSLGVDAVVVFAHAGHWLVQLLYAAPLIILVGILVAQKLRERRESRRDPVPGDQPQA